MIDIDPKQREQIIAELLSHSGEYHDRHRSYLNSHFNRILADATLLSKHLNKSTVIMDVGAIPPCLVYLLKLDGFENLVATDPHIEAFGDFFRTHGIKAHQSDVFDPSSPEDRESVDCLCICEVLEHLTGDILSVLERVSSRIAPGGHLYITTPNLRSISGVVALLRYKSGLAAKMRESVYDQYARVRSGDGYFGHVREYTAKEVIELFQSLGFSLVESRFQARPNPANRTERMIVRMENLTRSWRLFGKYLFVKEK